MAFRRIFVATLTIACVYGNLQETGYITFSQDALPNGGSRYHVANGYMYMEAIVSRDNILQDCRLSDDTLAVKHLMSDGKASKLHIGETALKNMIEDCELKMTIRKRNFDTKTTTALPFAPEKTGDPAGAMGSFAIFPGTKWCGLDNKASSYDDLGENRATDTCCRTHDHCPYFIDHFETKYNFRNPYPWTLSYCGCDNALYNCLKNVNTSASNEVGELFFGLLNVKCFDFEDGSYCEDSHFAGLWCEKEGYGEKAVPKTFPHTWKSN